MYYAPSGAYAEGQEAKAWGDIHGQDIMDNLFKEGRMPLDKDGYKRLGCCGFGGYI